MILIYSYKLENSNFLNFYFNFYSFIKNEFRSKFISK
jgi:hypothetical protein